jgi:hypothetical protein
MGGAGSKILRLQKLLTKVPKKFRKSSAKTYKSSDFFKITKVRTFLSLQKFR